MVKISKILGRNLEHFGRILRIFWSKVQSFWENLSNFLVEILNISIEFLIISVEILNMSVEITNILLGICVYKFRGEIEQVYGVRYTQRDFSVAERPEGYLGPRSGVIKYKCGVKYLERRGMGTYCSGAKRRGAELESIGATQSATERC